jgi:DNA polymerase III delta prime subunit
MTVTLEVLRRFIKHCDPNEPLAANDPLYVEFDAGVPVRGSGHASCIEAMYRSIELSDPTAETCQLFTGFPGTGKTTELLRLADKLKRAEDVRTQVVFVDFQDYVDLFAPISITDILRVLAFSLDRAALVAEGKDPDQTPGYLQRFWRFLNSEVELKQLKFEAYGPLLMAELKNNPTFHKKAEEALKLRFQQFADDARAAMTESVIRLRAATGAERIIVIADSIEKLTPVSEEDRGSMESSVEQVFLHYAHFLHLPCHAIYTFPLWLRFKTAGLGGSYDSDPFILPMVKIRDQSTGERFEHGISKLVELIDRRLELTAIFGEDAQETLVPLVEASGGYPRDLLRMVRELLRRTRLFPVTAADVQEVIDALAEQYGMIIRSTDLDLLAQVSASHALPPGDAAQLASFGRLLERWLVLAYRNGREWYDLHPLVRRSPIVSERLKSSTKT